MPSQQIPKDFKTLSKAYINLHNGGESAKRSNEKFIWAKRYNLHRKVIFYS